MRQVVSLLGLCACVMLTSVGLVGCGQAGPLYLPPAEPPGEPTEVQPS